MRLSKLLLAFLVVIFLIQVNTLFAQINNATSVNPLVIIQEQNEKLVKQMERAYRWKHYDKVIEISKKISILYPLSAKDNLIIAESYLRLGYPKEAISYANKVLTLRKKTFEACRAELIKFMALAVMEQRAKVIKGIKNFLNTFCSQKYSLEAQAILNYFGKNYKVPSKVLKKIQGIIVKARGLYLLRKDRLFEAERDIFLYLNVYGNLFEAPDLLFKLAEAYFKKKQVKKAKLLYQLIITKWDGTKQALLSKFRLYEIAYQQIVIKQLVPKETIQNLLSYIAEIKYRYPKSKIAQEAHLLEIQIYKQYKKFEKLRKSTKEFIKNYPNYPKLNQIFKDYCYSVTSILNGYYEKGNLPLIFKLTQTDSEFLKKTHCGYPFYLIGNILFSYNFFIHSAYEYIKAFNIGVPPRLRPDLLTKLTFLAFETGNQTLFNDLFEYTSKTFSNKTLFSSPFYTFCFAINELKKGVNSAEPYLKSIINSKIDTFYKWQILHLFRDKALSQKLYLSALNYTLHPIFNSTDSDFVLLLTSSFSNSSAFEKISEVALKKFPNSTDIKWIYVYYLEKHGRFKQALSLWKNLTNGTQPQNELAKAYEKFLRLQKIAHKLVY
ncbi:MAG: hypothetical protein GXO57_05055 [Thermodesulfobacteria bacterium]|nr:hypothetical protein [Thermodesulfobacteriota bacterium]